MLVFPTPESPIIITLANQSKSIELPLLVLSSEYIIFNILRIRQKVLKFKIKTFNHADMGKID